VPASAERAADPPAAPRPTEGRRALVRSGLVLGIAVAAANVLNAVFQFALARVLDPDEYALLAALYALVLVGAIPPLAFQATTARSVASDLAAGDRRGAGAILRGTLRSILRWTTGLLVATAIAVPLAAAAGVGEPLALGATVATVAVALAVPVVWGGLQGTGRFFSLSAAHLCFAGTRLVAGLAIGLAGGSVAAVMLGIAGATALTAIVTALPLRSLLAEAGRVARERLATRLNAGAAVALTALWALAYSDFVVGRLELSGDEAGAYAAAAVGSRVLLLAPIAVTTVLFPRVATLHDRTRERRHLVAGLAVVAAASAVVIAIAWIFAGTVIDLAFGSDYADAEDWIGPLSAAMALYGLAIVYLYHFLALGRTGISAVLVALFAAQAIVYAAVADAPSDLIAVQLAFGAATVVACEAWYLLRIRR
jgi:O-antigen/teichoic acid export membrane protein